MSLRCTAEWYQYKISHWSHIVMRIALENCQMSDNLEDVKLNIHSGGVSNVKISTQIISF
jgi:hypothetical protein